MKGRTKVHFVVALFLVLGMLSGCATRAYAPKANEEIYGTWTRVGERMEKIEMLPDGSWKEYIYAADTKPIAKGTFTLFKKWRDAEGNVWYETNVVETEDPLGTGNAQELDRISNDGTTWEYVVEPVGSFGPDKYPTELDPNSAHYRIRYRVTAQK